MLIKGFFYRGFFCKGRVHAGICTYRGVVTSRFGLCYVWHGVDLTLADFARLIKAPKAVITGFIGQIILLPLLALGFMYRVWGARLYCRGGNGFGCMSWRYHQ